MSITHELDLTLLVSEAIANNNKMHNIIDKVYKKIEGGQE